MATQLSFSRIQPAVDGSTTDRRLHPSLPLQLARALNLPASTHARVQLQCPRCGLRQVFEHRGRGRGPQRMERLIPRVPVRHWVFTLPPEAQAPLHRDPKLRTKVARACTGVVFDALRRMAQHRLEVSPPFWCGCVSVVHRLGAALDINVHVHALVLDGVYTRQEGGRGDPMFHPLPEPTGREVARISRELGVSVRALLRRRPGEPRPMSLWSEAEVTHRVACGPPIYRISNPSSQRPVVRRHEGFDVRAGPRIDAEDRGARLRLCRYLTRPMVEATALDSTEDGRLRYRLRHPFADGTTHVEFEPRVLVERLRQLVTTGGRPQVGYHGVLGPRAAREWIRPAPPRQLPLDAVEPLGSEATAKPAALPDRAPASNDRLADAKDHGTLSCPRCATSMRVLAVELSADAA